METDNIQRHKKFKKDIVPGTLVAFFFSFLFSFSDSGSYFLTDCPNLSSVLEVVGDGVLIIDTISDEVKYVNRALELLFEIERFTVLGKPLPSTIFNNSDDLKSFHSLAKKSIELFQRSNNALPSQLIGNSFIEREFSFPARTKTFNINVMFYPFNSLSTQSSKYNREFPTQVCCIFQRKKEKPAKKTKPKFTTNGCTDLNHSTSSSTDEDRDIPEYKSPNSYSNRSASTNEKSENDNSDNDHNNNNNNNNSKSLWTLDGSGLRLVVTERTPVSAGFAAGTRFPYDSLKYFRVNPQLFSDILDRYIETPYYDIFIAYRYSGRRLQSLYYIHPIP